MITPALMAASCWSAHLQPALSTTALALLASPGIQAWCKHIHVRCSHLLCASPLHSPPPSLPPSLPTEMNEALGLLTGAFANISIKGNQVGLPAAGHTPAFALRANAGGQGKAGKPTGACVAWLLACGLCRHCPGAGALTHAVSCTTQGCRDCDCPLFRHCRHG